MKIEQYAYKKGYRVNEFGDLISPTGKEIGSKHYSRSIPYIATTLRVDGTFKKLRAHRLQAYQKYGLAIYESGICVRHLNSNSLDNSKENIAIGTHSQNMMDKPKHVRLRAAEIATSYVRKHNKKDVKSYYSKCKSYKETMNEFGIKSKGTLHYILNK